MQYVRSISASVGGAWNSINPATLSGAIDVIVVEQEDGSLACSPFHIRFGKFRLLRPYEKKVEFAVNGTKQDFPMKLGEGGEAFFVFETRESVPEALQTSPLVSPATSPQLRPSVPPAPTLQEPDPFELEAQRDGMPVGKKGRHGKHISEGIPILQPSRQAHRDGVLSTSQPPMESRMRAASGGLSDYNPRPLPKLERNVTETDMDAVKVELTNTVKSGGHTFRGDAFSTSPPSPRLTDSSGTPPPPNQEDAKTRAMNLSKRLWTSNISNQVTDSGDLMLDMTGYKSSDGEALHAEVIARQLLSEEIDGPYDIGALIGADEKGNIWIYSSEEAKEAANRKAARGLGSYNPAGYTSTDALSDPGYHSDDARSDTTADFSGTHVRRDSDSALGMASQPGSPGTVGATGDPNKNYAKTLRLTSDQLRAMDLNPGANRMAFTVNRATCHATLWYWRHDVPIVISDIDGTITKSDVLGHAFNFIGRDWTHLGVAKLYTDIAANGYNFLYLTSRSVGQADTTRNYLDGVVQDGYRLPKGPVILSPDRTIAALRREVYLRKPEIFKMACLRDIMALFAGHGGANNITESADAGLHVNIRSHGGLGNGRGRSGSPFYAGFGNRLTDALSYRSVNIPSTRIFTINSNSEISLDLLSLNKYKTAYSSMREIVDHYFPPVGLLVKGGGEEFTDFNYWRVQPLEIADFTDSDSDSGGAGAGTDDYNAINNALERLNTDNKGSVLSEDEAGDDMINSFISDPRLSLDESVPESVMSDDDLASSMMQDETDDADGEEEADDDDEEEAEDEADEEEAQKADKVEDEAPVTPDIDESKMRRGDGFADRETTPKQTQDTLPNENNSTARRTGVAFGEPIGGV